MIGLPGNENEEFAERRRSTRYSMCSPRKIGCRTGIEPGGRLGGSPRSRHTICSGRTLRTKARPGLARAPWRARHRRSHRLRHHAICRRAAGEEIRLADEISHIAIERLIVELARTAGLHDLAFAHDADFIAHRQRFFLVMRHQQKRDSDIALQILQFDLHLAAQFAIECGKRFIEEQHRRPIYECPRQRHALLLAAGKFPGSPPLIAGEAHHGERFGDSLLDSTEEGAGER